jgi:hypothetical protein
MQAVSVGRGINGDRFDTHFAGRADNPQCDFSAVCNQYFFKHDVELRSKK